MTIEYEDLVLGAVESEVDVEGEGGGEGEGEVGHRGHQVHPVWPREVLGTGRAKDKEKYQIYFSWNIILKRVTFFCYENLWSRKLIIVG